MLQLHKPSKIKGSVADPGCLSGIVFFWSRIRIFSIPDLGVKKALDPGSGYATVVKRYIRLVFLIREGKLGVRSDPSESPKFSLLCRAYVEFISPFVFVTCPFPLCLVFTWSLAKSSAAPDTVAVFFRLSRIWACRIRNSVSYCSKFFNETMLL